MTFFRLLAGCLLFLFLISRSVCTLDPNKHISQYAHSAWRMQDGAFSGAPNVITQTKDGYVWIGTLDGLVRFDGARFVAMATPGGQASMDGKITSLLTGRDGTLWVGTRSGLNRVRDGVVFNYSDGVSGVSTIIEDHAGRVWLTRYRVKDGMGPLCTVDGDKLHCYGKNDGIPVEYAVGLSEDSLGNFWIGSYVLCRWKPGSLSTIYFEKELNHLKGNPGVVDIASGPAGSVWAALETAGPKLGVTYFADDKWSSYVAKGFEGSSVKAHCFLVDRDKSLWIGTENQGLYRIRDGVADHYGSADGLSSDAISGLFQDREGNIWVATDGGLDCFRNLHVVSISIREGLSAAGTTSVLALRDGSVLVGNQGALDILRDGKIFPITTGHGLPGDIVSSMLEDNAGRTWMGIDGKLFIYEGGKFREIRKADGSHFAEEGFVHSLAEDTRGDIWVVASKASTSHLFRVHNFESSPEIPLPGMPYASSLATGEDGSIWIGTSGNVFGRYKNESLEVFSLPHDEKPISINGLLADSGNSVWITTDRGIFKWKDGRVNALDSRNGLPCTSVITAIRDNQNFLWVYAQCGLLKIADSELQSWWTQPDKKVEAQTFDSLNGVSPGRAPSYPKACKSKDGRLWFVNGLLLQTIDPALWLQNHVVPPVQIEEVIADRKQYSSKGELRLPALTRGVEINYTALSFVSPQQVHFRYMLEGHDKTWEDPGKRRQAFYNDLRPGPYRFRVVASNNDGVWNETGASLDFTVAAAWYQTITFRILCVVVSLLAIFSFYHIRMNQIAAGISARFDERLAERTRIARDLHDTFLQTIQGSKMVVDDALEKPTDPAHMRRAMERVSEWLEQATKEGRAVLNSLRTSTVQKNDLAAALKRATENDLVPNSMAVSFSVVGDAREMHPIVRDEVYRIGYEAMRNACVHSHATQLDVELKYAQDLTLSVRDNGIGMNSVLVASGKEGHFGLPGMRERAARIESKLTIASSTTSGTSITLIVPASIIFRVSRTSVLDRAKILFKRNRPKFDV